mgnify:CR=1 FL=1
MRIDFLPPAREELDGAFGWYEDQAAGLGFAFLVQPGLLVIVAIVHLHLEPACWIDRAPRGALR